MDLNIGLSHHRVTGSSDLSGPSASPHTQAGVAVASGSVANKTDSRRGPRLPDAPASIELHIEELVLHGFFAGDRFRLGDAIQQELARLITEQGLPGIADVERLDAGSFQIAPGARAQSIGAQLARHLHPRLSGERTPAMMGPQQKRSRVRE